MKKPSKHKNETDLDLCCISSNFFHIRMVSDPENPLVLSVLRASSTAYSYKPDEKIDEVRPRLSNSPTEPKK